MESQTQKNQLWRFDSITVDRESRRLLIDGESRPLEPRLLRLLLFLIENRGRAVSKEEILSAVWEGTFVSENALTRAIGDLRKALGDDPKNPRYIETVPTFGYRFAAELVDPGAEPVATAPAETASPSRPAKPRLWILGLAGILLIAAAALWFLRTPAGDVTSIAVLPFQDFSKDAGEEWFSDGVTESLITELTRIHSLTVISRTSVMQYRKPRADLNIKQIGRDLGVDTIVEGSVTRDGNRVRITAQLISAATDRHLWANDFEGDISDVLGLQRQVAREVASEIRAALTPAEKQSLGTARARLRPDAVSAYLRAVHLYNRGTLPEALDLAREAVRLEPALAEAWELLGEVLMLRADFHQVTYSEIDKDALAAFRRALELDPDHGSSTAQIGWLQFVAYHQWTAAETNLRRGTEISPTDGTLYAFLLAAQGKYDEAIRIARVALQHDPASALLLTDCARLYQFAGRYDEAIASFRKALQLDPAYGYALFHFVPTLLLAGRPDEALDRWISGGENRERFRAIYRSGGWPAVWAAYLPEISDRPVRRVWPLIDLHRNQEALDVLEQLEKTSDPWVSELEDRAFDPLRNEPRFIALKKRLGYPQ